MVKRIAIIPARGGSKRIPDKNIIDFDGKPMIAWTIEAANRSKLFDRVVVSTDSPEIAKLSKNLGAEAPFLRNDHADDFSTVSEATVSALLQAKEFWQEDYDSVVQLMANCPLRDEFDIRDAVGKFEEQKREFQISCFEYGWMNPWWAAKLHEDGQPEQLFKSALSERSQDLPTLYCPTGAIWVADAALLQQSKSFYAPGYTFHPLSWQHAVDIDDFNDLDFAQAVASQLIRQNKRQEN